jgi:uncharacterized repeat protein (TIGR01451 family)
MKRCTALSFITAAALLASAGQAQVVISQLYGGGGGSGTYVEDFAVLFNRGTTPVTLTNAGLFYASATGNFNPASSQRVRLPVSLTIPAGGSYLVILNNAVGTTTTSITTTTIAGSPLVADFVGPGSTVAGGPAGVISASQSNGKVALLDNFNWSLTTTATAFLTAGQPTSPGATVADFVGYGSANASEGAAAPALTNTTLLVRGNVGCDDSDNNSADFTAVSVAVTGGINPIRSSQSGINLCGVAVADLATTITGPACGTLNTSDPAAFTVTVTNTGALAATGTQATVVLPSNLTFVSATGGTTSYDAPSRTLTWTLGTVPAGGGSSALTVNTTVAGGGTTLVNVNASTTATEPGVANNVSSYRNFIGFSGPGYTTAVTPLLVAVPAAFETATGFTAGALGQVTDTLGSPVTVRTIPGRPTASANGQRLAFWAETSAGDSGGSTLNFDGLLVAGEISGTTLNKTTIIAESTSLDGQILRRGVGSTSAIATPSINNAGDFAFATQRTDTNTTGEVITGVVVKGNVSAPSTLTVVARELDPVTGIAGIGAGVNWAGFFNATSITSSGEVAFTGRLAGTGVVNNGTGVSTVLGNDFVAVRGTTLLARKNTVPGFVPTNSAGTVAGKGWAFIGDNQRDGLGFQVDASGTNWALVGALGDARTPTGGTNPVDASVYVVNGDVKLQENFAIAGSGLSDTLDVGSPFYYTTLTPDGNWLATGSFEAVPATGNGTDWALRNGTLLAKTGDAITPGNTETWSGSVFSFTFTSATGLGDDWVLTGSTSNTDRATDNVVVWGNGAQRQVVLREGQPVTINGTTFYIGFIPSFRGQTWITSDRKLVTYVRLSTSSNICLDNINVPTNYPSALISVNLPAVVVGPTPCGPSDIAGPGPSAGADGELTADDIIFFISNFTSNNLVVADIAGPGPTPGADGELTADDIILFINRFTQFTTSGCP